MAELRRANIIIRLDEALAIVQSVIEASRHLPASSSDAVERPLSPERVFIAQNGSVSCIGCDLPPAISDIAALFQALVPRNARISGSLRYALARARLEVDAPPFESLDEFSRALGRHERADRADVLRGLVQRAAPIGMRSSPFIERRRAGARASDLRRELRDADARVYDQQLAIAALGAMVPVEPSRGRRGLFMLATVAAGLVLVGAGEAIRSRPEPPAERKTTVSEDRRVPERRAEPVKTPDVESSPTIDEAPSKPAPMKPAVKRTSTNGGAHAQRPRRQQPQQRSRFNWLRTKIVFRSEPL